MVDAEGTYFDDRIPAIFKKIEKAINGGKGYDTEGGEAALQDRLYAILTEEFSDIEDIQATMIMDQLITENVLTNLCEKTLAKRLFPQGFKRKFSLLTQCPSCESSSRKSRREQSRQYQEKTIDRHVMQVEFLEADLGIYFQSSPENKVYDYLHSKGFYFECPGCATPLDIITSSNHIVPDVDEEAMADELIYALMSNVKSGARYCEKIVHDMFWPRFKELGYDEKKRSLIDKYRFAIIPNVPTKLPAGRYRSKFKRTFGVGVPRGKLEDQACYAVREVLKRSFGFGRTGLQDDIANPVPRRSKVTGHDDYHKMLQFPVHVNGKVFECKILSYETEIGARGRIKGYSHQTYALREKKKRKILWTRVPETDTVHSILMRLFHHQPLYIKENGKANN